MSELPQGFAIPCDRCHKLLLDCACQPPAKPAPLPAPFSVTVPPEVGARMVVLLIAARAPYAVEYLRGEILLAVPRKFHVVLTACQATAELSIPE